jgi:hypothetical protein
MKKTCRNCRALASYGCELGKKTEVTVYVGNGYMDERKPLEECHKPTTYTQYLYMKGIK